MTRHISILALPLSLWFVCCVFNEVALSQEQSKEWKDSTGRFQIEATLEGVEGEVAVLSRADGKTIRVPISRLRQSDQEYVMSFRKKQQTSVPDVKSKKKRAKDTTVPLDQVLARPANISFANEPLSTCIEKISEQHSINFAFLINPKRDRNPTWAHTEITYQSTNETLEEALSSILSPLSLEWSNFHGVLVIAADKDLVSSTRVYLVKQARFVKDFDFRNIVKFIFENVAKTSWEKGDGRLMPVYPDFLVIYQTPSAHREIEKLQDVALPPAIARKTGFDARNPLSKEISVSFADTPLYEAIKEIAEKSNVRISLDTKQLAASSLAEQQYITLSLQNVRAESVLTLVLLPLDLYYFKDKSVIQVRSKSYAYQHPITVAHDISGIHGDGYNPADHVQRLLEDFIETDTWSHGGGNGTISLIPPSQLSITNAEHVQIAIKQLLQELRNSAR